MTEGNLREFECIEPDEDAYADYSARFGQYNQDGSGWRVQTFSLILRDGERIIAGGRGHVYLGALEVRGLWVDDLLRGQGVGSDLFRAIEQEAKRRGATKAMLYTYSWQAEAFYEAYGYKEFARFDFPKGHYRVDMQKAL
ncbi:GNAT family N-acetyltransferase [Ruegeria sp. 2012CJ41-6]|uniref:GNAT family N-acetyltransferase n=1 Tax=Ruegeria spongiae TaxID=2942209 RepID=A0ABT0Q483_9RHOB|nr:GNAT family N-acetyltransferase [Ruegeria spongiae]MCL6284252.1 GNAT family N-acetyltransferase [Ruegeria spongiae]